MQIEIWSDVVCPWCYIGKRRFETAVGQFEHRDRLDVVWRSFELDPSAPSIRHGDSAQRLADKYGISREQAVQRQSQVVTLAAGEGLQFRYDIAQAGNTFDAHRVLHLAHEQGLQDALQERLFRGYFSEGEAVGDRDTLVRLAAEAGIATADAKEVLESDAFTEAVRADELEARELGISGVPFFVIDRRYGVSGAQPAELLLHALQQAWSDSHPALVLTGAGAACTDDACEI